MGSDDLFRKNKNREARALAREQALRDQYAKILIVCEGTKTEPNYFKAMRGRLGLNPRNVIIYDKPTGCDPLKIVKLASDKICNDKDYDEGYCVFDRDSHQTYEEALEKISHDNIRLKKENDKLKRKERRETPVKLHAITSNPCFEVWLLLHYGYTTKPFDSSYTGGSRCESVIKELRKKGCIPDYEKGAADIFSKTEKLLETALVNAEKLEKFHETSGTDNPSTQVHILVKKLKEMEEQRKKVHRCSV